jgi:hypothetical protein
MTQHTPKPMTDDTEINDHLKAALPALLALAERIAVMVPKYGVRPAELEHLVDLARAALSQAEGVGASPVDAPAAPR